MKLGLVAEPDLVKELIALLAISQNTSRCKKAVTVCRLPTWCLVNGDLIQEQLIVVSGQAVSGGFATAQFLVQPSERLVWASLGDVSCLLAFRGVVLVIFRPHLPFSRSPHYLLSKTLLYLK